MAIQPPRTAASTVIEADSPVRALESRAIRGTYYIAGAYGLSMCIRLFSSVVLSRIFLPQYFGLMALITTVIVGLNLFSHVGIQDSIIQNPRGDEPDFLNTAWTIQVIRGFGIAMLSIPLAWPVARFYHNSEIVSLLPVLGATCVIAGFSSPGLLTLSRHMGVGRLSVLDLVGQIVQFVVTLVWALLDHTIWALVGGRIASELVRTFLSYRLLPEQRAHFLLDPESLRELFKFGKWILVGTALTFVAVQSDRLILAKLVSFRLLGVYGIAFGLAALPHQIITQFCDRIGFPFIARFSDRPREEFRQVLLKYRRIVLLAGGFLIVGVISIGDGVIGHLYTQPYWGAKWMIGILTLGLWHKILYSTTLPAVLSLQKSSYNAVAYLLYCVALYTALPFGYRVAGIVGAVAAIAASDLPVYFVTAYSASREGIATWRQDLWLTIAFAAFLALVLVARHAMGFGWPFPALHASA